MALTGEDLKQIKAVVNEVVIKVVNDATSKLATKTELAEARLATQKDLDTAVSSLATKTDLDRLTTKVDLDRMEARLAAGMGLLERNAYTRLDQHETRINQLEKARI